MHKILISNASALALTIASAHSQDLAVSDGLTLDTITIVANRAPFEGSKIGSTVETVTKAEIEENSFISIRDYLALLPGVSFTANGGIGTQSNIYIRGLPGGYVKTLYNGIDISDTTGTQVATQYQHILTGGITGIEMLQGSQSTLYGSNAIAGVVDIATLGNIPDGINHTLNAEGGSFGTARAHYGITAAKNGSEIAANISGFHTDGISARAGGSERDGYENLKIDLAAQHRINEVFSVFGSLLYIDAKAEYDGTEPYFPYAPDPDDADSYERTKMRGGRIGFNVDLMEGRLKNTFSFQGFKTDREDNSGGYTTTFIGHRQKFDYQGSFQATDRFLLQYGLDHERQKAEVDDPIGRIDLTGAWTQAVLEPIDNLVLTAGIRHDEHSTFGGYTTGRGTLSYLFEQTNTRLHSSYGTGFRAPSLYQLYAPWDMGNPNLQPETSRSFDIGVEQKFLNNTLTTDVTYFWTEIEDLIDWDNDTYSYNQRLGTTSAQGIEASFIYAATSWLDLGGSYTYTHSELETGDRRPNIPRHMAVLSASLKPAEKWTISSDIKLVTDTVDFSGKLNDYALLNAKIAYQLTENTEVYLRGENLLDQDYQTVRGYNTLGIAAYAGFKAKF